MSTIENTSVGDNGSPTDCCLEVLEATNMTLNHGSTPRKHSLFELRTLGSLRTLTSEFALDRTTERGGSPAKISCHTAERG